MINTQLNDAERALLETINFDPLTFQTPADAVRNGGAARDLTKKLVARGAIPQVRLKYFTDPDYYPGGLGCCRRENFERWTARR
jgi:hypothetical protein